MVEVLPDDAPAPRLCHLIKWPDFDGYGFNLHAERSNPGQFIGQIDDNSPAQLAGLREADRIIEVNGVNISNENHRQVVERIKSNQNEARLLVVDPQADRWYREQELVIKSSQSNVIYMRTPVPRPGSNINNNNNNQNQDEPLDSIERQSAPMSPDSGRGELDDQQQQQQVSSSSVRDDDNEQAKSQVVVIEAEINKQTPPISELSRKQKQLVLDEVRQKIKRHDSNDDDDDEEQVLKQQQQVAPIQPDSLNEDLSHADAKERERQKHSGSADSGKPTDSTSGSSSASIADSLEDNESRTEINKQQQSKNNNSTIVDGVNEDASRKENNSRVNNSAEASFEARPISSDDKIITNSEKEQKVTERQEPKQEEEDKIEKQDKSIEVKEQVEITELADRMTKAIATKAGDAKTTSPQQQSRTTNVPVASTISNKNPTVAQQQMNISNNNNNYSGLNLNMTASQMRELIASRKKFDPKKAQMNIRQKYEIIQQM